MTHHGESSLRDIFIEALEREGEKARDDFLEQACRGDADMRRRVEGLLRAHEKAGPIEADDSGEQDATATDGPDGAGAARTESAGDRIGRYKLLQQIGEGGCGVVWMAEQEEPVRRRVALKVIKLGMDTRAVMARFEAERQALAMMDHPNIAKVFDAGATEAGRPFFVMELVRGIPITNYCDQHNLSTAERLELFTKVCAAVQHAHQKGVIHRDLKPSNVLVTRNEPDRLGIPKVIDFGIAKATGTQLTERTLFTEFHQFIGTPAYMSPEQAGRNAQDIDTRSDVYSLGVMLYELLTGKTPFDARELLQRGLDTMLRALREEEPPKPSTRLITMIGGELSATAQHRRIAAPKLVHLVRGDLDWIVMKALEKDRARRYDTANSLATDILRHLRNEPVLARPPSALYRFRKLVRRNRVVFAAGAAVVAALVAGAVVSTWQAVRATEAEHGQRQLRREAEGRLYDALVGEARALRMARGLGYRAEVFSRLQQAARLAVPQRNARELRREAAACLGDLASMPPVSLGRFPDGTALARLGGLRIDPVGRVAAIPLDDGSILLREIPGGRDAGRLAAEHPVWGFCFDAEGARLLSLHLPKEGSFEERLSKATAHLWSRTADGTWAEDAAVPMPGGYECLEVGGALVAVAADFAEDSLKLVDPSDMGVVAAIPFPERLRVEEFRARPVASPDGQLLAVPAAMDVEVWNLTEHRSVARFDSGLQFLTNVVFSGDGKHLACLGSRGCVFHETAAFGRVASLGDGGRSGMQTAFDARGTFVLPLPEPKRLRLWDARRSRDVAVLDLPFAPAKAVFSPDGDWLLAAGQSEACLLRPHLKSEKLVLPGFNLAVPGARFSPDGGRLAAVDRGNTLMLWDAVHGRALWEAGSLPRHGGYAVDFSPDGRLVATAHWSSQAVWIWEAATGRRLQTLRADNQGHGGVGWSVRFSPDGRHLIAAHTPPDGAGPEPVGLTVWPVDSQNAENPCGPVVRSLNGHHYNLVLAPDNRQLACTNYFGDAKLHVWDYTGDGEARVLTEDILSSGQNLCFAEDGRQLVFLDRTRNVVVLDCATASKLRSFPTGEAPPKEDEAGEVNLLLSPDESRLAISSENGRGVDVWELSGGRLLYSLPDESAVVTWLDWSPDSRRLAVARSDGGLAIWDLAEVQRVLGELGIEP